LIGDLDDAIAEDCEKDDRDRDDGDVSNMPKVRK
jgi:hypothetical protein